MASLYSVSVSLLFLISSVFADFTEGTKRNKVVYCGACLALAQELEWYIGTTSDKQTIDTGGFRLDSKGNIVTKKVPLKRSDIHLNEVFEYICRRMSTYNEVLNPDTGAINYIPSESRDGHKISTKGVKVSADVGNSLEFACDSLLEEYEDSLIAMFRAAKENIEIGEKLCVDMAGLCSMQQYSEQRSAIEDLNLAKDGSLAKKLADGIADMPDMYSREAIEKLIKEYDAEVKTPKPVPEDDVGEAWEWEYGVPPPPTDHDEL
ncbi:hypothetical protein CAPTEDRAFT_220809 [Capitella teleta]|uniref:DUF3456 domain-containing protein n=1 Tax=Capitella teleta TaxID=283909 RepID=R7U1S1_CAPTE|nr:hypothetical protein CAPTEDRAFT_220809 [Capitella teleta]|eukprot:ELU00179.1 hypothetical protein CAPTEDRAFT_220809 [Capitella teleta]